jgi:hypothetical protein
MIVRKKDWIALQERLTALEKSNSALRDLTNKTESKMVSSREAEDIRRNLKSLIESSLVLRSTVFAALGKIKACFSDYNIYTPAEIDKMSSSDYAKNVLEPLGIQMSSVTKFY